MVNSVADELKKAFDHVGLHVDLVHIGYRPKGGPDPLQQFSFWVPDDYRFQGHNPGHHWRRVEDESPKDGTEVLIWPRDGGQVTALYDRDLRFVTDANPNVTHWMPLPAPPSD